MLALYTASKAIELNQRNAVNSLTLDLSDHYSDEFEFGNTQGLNIAIGLIDVFDDEFVHADETYGHLKIQTYTWGFDDLTGAAINQLEDLTTH